MKKPEAKAARPLPDPRQVLNQAIRFMAAERYLRGVSDPNMLRDFGPPTVVMAAFAAELLLKAVHILESQPPPETHNLHTLFKRLPNKRKQRITNLWERVAPAREKRLGNIEAFARANLPGLSDLSIPRDLRTSLMQCGDAFDRGRYLYENPQALVYFIEDFAPVLVDTVLEIRPDWATSGPPVIFDPHGVLVEREN